MSVSNCSWALRCAAEAADQKKKTLVYIAGTVNISPMRFQLKKLQMSTNNSVFFL
jgi:hypothetical protein